MGFDKNNKKLDRVGHVDYKPFIKKLHHLVQKNI